MIFLGLHGKIRERAFVCNKPGKQLKVIDGNIEIVDILLPPDNEIWYKTSDGLLYDLETIIMGVEQMGITYSGPDVLTNSWDEDLQMYRLVFDSSVTEIGVNIDFSTGEINSLYPIFTNNSDYGL